MTSCARPGRPYLENVRKQPRQSPDEFAPAATGRSGVSQNHCSRTQVPSLSRKELVMFTLYAVAVMAMAVVTAGTAAFIVHRRHTLRPNWHD